VRQEFHHGVGPFTAGSSADVVAAFRMTRSIRRLLARAAAVVLGTRGWNSPYPVADSRWGSIPRPIRNSTTRLARAAERSQLDENRMLWIGMSSVWP
jgi:hypothetical protein